jgi:hypothetical protein
MEETDFRACPVLAYLGGSLLLYEAQLAESPTIAEGN